MLISNFPEKGLGLVFAPDFLDNFFKKNVSHVYMLLTEQISLSDTFVSQVIGQYVYYNCLLTRLWHHKI